MKSVRISIIAPSQFRKMVKTPRDQVLSDDATIIDLISQLDQEYFPQVITHPEDFKTVFYDDRILSLLQLIWDPRTQRFYEDVNLEARSAAPESNNIPIEKQWNTNLPNGSWIVIIPEIGS